MTSEPLGRTEDNPDLPLPQGPATDGGLLRKPARGRFQAGSFIAASVFMGIAESGRGTFFGILLDVGRVIGVKLS